MKFPSLTAMPSDFAAELRREIFLLGGRHQGDVLAGARKELGTNHLTVARRALLLAVIKQATPPEQAGAAPAQPSLGPRQPPARDQAAVVAVAIAIAACIALTLWSMQG